jgi:Uma2 family endonuclease
MVAERSELPLRYRITATEYEAMGAHGIFNPSARLELIDGEIVTMSPIGWKHMNAVNMLNALLGDALQRRAIVSVQNPVVLSKHDVPEPDIAILRLPASPRQNLPTASDVWFLIEVSDTTLDYDVSVKLPLYARAGVPEVWILDIEREMLTQYLQPIQNRYARSASFRRGEAVTASVLPDIKLAVDDILS